ncbi:MAG: hypothetical protein JNK05_34440 [Myxococcales bacterium]|nr:hypothetical protein [Myxococcales bacterium]
MTKRSTDKDSKARRGRSASDPRSDASVTLTAPPREPPLVKRAALVAAASALLVGCGSMGPVMTPGIDTYSPPRPDATDEDHTSPPPPMPPPMPPPPMIDVTETPDSPTDVTPRPMVDAFVEDRPVIAPMPPPRDE